MARMPVQLLNAAAKGFPALLRDGLGLIGLLSITYGTWLLSHPVGFIVGGVLAVATAALLARADSEGAA